CVQIVRDNFDLPRGGGSGGVSGCRGVGSVSGSASQRDGLPAVASANQTDSQSARAGARMSPSRRQPMAAPLVAVAPSEDRIAKPTGRESPGLHPSGY